MKTRKKIIDEAVRIRAEISQIFIDIEHWNICVRKPGEEPINPDPDGSLARTAAQLDEIIAQR